MSIVIGISNPTLCQLIRAFIPNLKTSKCLKLFQIALLRIRNFSVGHVAKRKPAAPIEKCLIFID